MSRSGCSHTTGPERAQTYKSPSTTSTSRTPSPADAPALQAPARVRPAVRAAPRLAFRGSHDPTSCERAFLVTRRQPSPQAQRVCDRGEVIDVAVDGVQAEAHGDHREVGPACLAPGIDLGREIARGALRPRDILPAEVFDRPA